MVSEVAICLLVRKGHGNPRKKRGAQLILDIQTAGTLQTCLKDPKTPEEVWLDGAGYKGMYYI